MREEFEKYHYSDISGAWFATNINDKDTADRVKNVDLSKCANETMIEITKSIKNMVVRKQLYDLASKIRDLERWLTFEEFDTYEYRKTPVPYSDFFSIMKEGIENKIENKTLRDEVYKEFTRLCRPFKLDILDGEL